jgi:hypothetical protein
MNLKLKVEYIIITYWVNISYMSEGMNMHYVQRDRESVLGKGKIIPVLN